MEGFECTLNSNHYVNYLGDAWRSSVLLGSVHSPCSYTSRHRTSQETGAGWTAEIIGIKMIYFHLSMLPRPSVKKL